MIKYTSQNAVVVVDEHKYLIHRQYVLCSVLVIGPNVNKRDKIASFDSYL